MKKILVKITARVIAQGLDCPPIGAIVQVDEDFGRHLIEAQAAVLYETKVDPLPEVKKKAQSESAPPARAPRRKTRARSRKSATKS